MPTPRTIIRLAAASDTDPRTVRKALQYGIEAIRGRAGERIAEAAVREGIALPNRQPSQPPHAA